jgi:hypothetical protein
MIKSTKSLAEKFLSTDGLHFKSVRPYRCELCSDTGLVTVVHPDTIKGLVLDPDSKEWGTCIVLCRCDAATRVAPRLRSGGHNGRMIPTFGDRPWHIHAHNPEARIKAHLYEEKPDNFNPTF